MTRRMERGQATVELLAGVPLACALGVVLLQLLAVGYSAVLAGVAAEAGALARASGGDPRAAARSSVPGWSRARMRVSVSRDAVSIRLRPPSPSGALARSAEVRAAAKVGRP